MFRTSLQKSFKIFLVLLLFSCFTSTILAQQTVTYKVLGISVSGNKSADAATIILNSGLNVGEEIQIPGDQTLNAIRQLWTLNIFSDVDIIIDREIAEGIFLLIKVEEYPRLERVIINGNDAIDTDDIEQKITFLRGSILKPQEISKLKRKILTLYEEEGFLNAKVDIDRYVYFTADTVDDDITVIWRNEKDLSDELPVEYLSGERTYSNLIGRIKDRVVLKLTIVEGDVVVVRKITVVGNTAFEDDDITSAMDETGESVWWQFWSGADFNPTAFEKDKQLILDYYRSEGYRDAEILKDSLYYYNDNKDLEIILRVHEGPQYKVRNIIWEGNTVYPDQILTQRLEFTKGDIYDFQKFQMNLRGNEQQSDVSALYLDNGYLTFNLEPEEVRVAEDSVDLIIHNSRRLL
jgi:outer membrane protein insertion porin family